MHMRIRILLFLLMGWQIVMAQKPLLLPEPVPGCQAARQAAAMTGNYPTDPRSDSVDILHIDLQLDLSQRRQQQISGEATLQVLPLLQGVAEVRLDLEGLSVQSVAVDGLSQTVQYDNRYLTVALSGTTDTQTIVVVYSGTPKQDASGWGGFYFSNDVAFNLGVGFAADPHNYGRIWYPCFDNFTEKSTYHIHVTATNGERAVAVGRSAGTTDNGDGTTTWHFRLSQPIPSYLVSVAAGLYTALEGTYAMPWGNVPYRLTAQAGDTTRLRQSFVHLQDAIEAFGTAYGPEPFGLVGYVLVPFNGGAMEHPTNIAYPRSTVDGTTNFETLMAHELAHHWWGDLVTCTTAEDMWLNEGWASYSEHLFLEHVYGREAYADEVRANHDLVLHKAHVNDDGFRAISGVPHAYTYGTHSYQKGADVIHTLRSYMGDVDFFRCIQSYLQAFKWKTGNSQDFMDYLTVCSGKDMEPFFDAWVFTAGQPHFSVDSMLVRADGNDWQVTTFVRQRGYGRSTLSREVPLELYFHGEDGSSHIHPITMTGGCVSTTILLPFRPDYVVFDEAEKIADAITDETIVLQPGDRNRATAARMDIRYVDGTFDSLSVHVAHHWVAPDRMLQPPSGLILSPNRYWQLSGSWDASTTFNVRFPFNGTTNSDGYLDNDLITNSEDSLLLLYRPGAGHEWTVWPSFSLQTAGTAIDKRGFIDATGVRPGEYCLAILDAGRTDTVTSSIPAGCQNLTGSVAPAAPQLLNMLQVYPNPATDTLYIDLPGGLSAPMLEVTDTRGQLIFQALIMQQGKAQVNCSAWGAGMYVLQLKDGQRLVAIGQVVVQ